MSKNNDWADCVSHKSRSLLTSTFYIKTQVLIQLAVFEKIIFLFFFSFMCSRGYIEFIRPI